MHNFVLQDVQFMSSGLSNFKRKVVRNLLDALPASNIWIKFLSKSVTRLSPTPEKASGSAAGVQGRRGNRRKTMRN